MTKPKPYTASDLIARFRAIISPYFSAPIHFDYENNLIHTYWNGRKYKLDINTLEQVDTHCVAVADWTEDQTIVIRER